MNTTRLFKLLVVEDNIHFVNFLRDKLTLPDYELEVADNAETALQKFQNENYDLVLLDLGLPRRPGVPAEVVGFELLKHFKTIDPTVEVIVLTGMSTEIDSVIRAIKDGAYHFLIKDDYQAFAEKLYTTIQNALQKRTLERNQRALLKQAKYFAESQKRVHRYQHPDLNYHFGLLLGESAAMQDTYTIIQKLSLRSPNETVLLCGEPGTGKDLTALCIHAQSTRGERPWIVANIAALPGGLMESELFGIQAKTATGVEEKVGYFEQADGSSIFLDEIGDVPPEVQVKLLRVLEQKEIQRVGSTKPITVEARVIAATNRNLNELMAQGKFREDLYFRLNVIAISLPPLRQRRDDIPLLIRHFCYFARQEEKNPALQISDDAVELLQAYDWPGNIRELKNMIRKATILRNHDTLTAADFRPLLPPASRALSSNHAVLEPLPSMQNLSPSEPFNFKSIRDERLRHKILLRTLIEHEGRIKELLNGLDIARNTGYRFLDEAQNLLLAGLCLANGEIEALAGAWGIDAHKLEKTIRRANRLAGYFEDLQNRYGQDNSRIAAFLNVKIEQLEKVAKYLANL